VFTLSPHDVANREEGEGRDEVRTSSAQRTTATAERLGVARPDRVKGRHTHRCVSSPPRPTLYNTLHTIFKHAPGTLHHRISKNPITKGPSSSSPSDVCAFVRVFV
jgi:hypothetical protein